MGGISEERPVILIMLTSPLQIDNTLSMAGAVRAKGKCPKCAGKFCGDPLRCPDCLIPPRKYYIDLHHKGHGRLRIFCDRQGHSLDSWQRATRVIESIRYEIDNYNFDPSRYVSADIKNFLFEIRVSAWYESKLKEVEKENLATSYTRGLKRFIDRYYLPFFQGKDVREVRTYHIEQFYEQLPCNSLKYIKNIISSLENFFNTLHRHEFITQKPSFPVITLDRKAPKWIDYDMQVKILETIPEADRPIFAFLSFQGVRPGEGRALKVKDVNLERKCLTISRTFLDRKVRERVKGKVEKPRLINPILEDLLWEHCKDKHPEASVFLNPRTQKAYSEDALYRVWDVARKQVGVDVTLYQATRHSLASIAVCNGAPLTAIQDVLGHTDIRTTLKYAHTNLESQKVVFNRQGSIKGEVIDLKPQ